MAIELKSGMMGTTKNGQNFVIIDDYVMYEDGGIDFTDCDLKKAVEENVEFPLKDWNLDEFEVVLE